MFISMLKCLTYKWRLRAEKANALLQEESRKLSAAAHAEHDRLEAEALRRKYNEQVEANRLAEENAKFKNREALLQKRNEIDNIKLQAETASVQAQLALAQAQLAAAKKKTIVHELDSGSWNKEEGAIKAAKAAVTAWQIANGYRYSRIFHIAGRTSGDPSYPHRKIAQAAFSDDPVQIFNADDEIVRMVIHEAKAVVPALMIHPDKRIREIVEKVCKKGDEDELNVLKQTTET